MHIIQKLKYQIDLVRNKALEDGGNYAFIVQNNHKKNIAIELFVEACNFKIDDEFRSYCKRVTIKSVEMQNGSVISFFSCLEHTDLLRGTCFRGAVFYDADFLCEKFVDAVLLQLTIKKGWSVFLYRDWE